MSDGVELHNLLPDPKPVDTSRWNVAGRLGHINAIPKREPAEPHQSEFCGRSIGTQHDRWRIHAPASRAHDGRRNGRIPARQPVRPVLPVSHALPRLVVVA